MHGQGTGKRVRGNECVSRGQGYGGAPPQRVSPKEGFRTECRKGCGETVQGSRPVLLGAQALKALPRPGPGGSPATVIPAHDFSHLQYKFPSVPQKPGHWARCGGAVVKVLVKSMPGIPYGRRYYSQQPRFPSSSLPVARESSRGRSKALGPAPAWETRKRLLASDWLSSSRGGRLGSESSDRRSSSLSLLLSVYLPFQ